MQHTPEHLPDGGVPSTHGVVGSYATYGEAQTVVDRLSDTGFDVHDVLAPAERVGEARRLFAAPL